MKNLSLIFFIILFFPKYSFSHTDHYKNFNFIEMEIFRNNKVVGFTKYEFLRKQDELEVKNETNFEVKIMGVKIFSIFGKSSEKYKNNKLISFNSETLQNNKKKYVNLIFNENSDKFQIDGSSYKGFANKETIIGNWWNHQILQAEAQISPLSGSIKKQSVEFIKKEIIEMYGKKFTTDHFKLKSSNTNVPDNKKLNFDIWLDKETNLILKIAYDRFGNWEYRLKNIN